METHSTPTIDHDEEEWEDDYPEDASPLPVRPRRRLMTPVTGLLLAVIIGAAGFYAGVRVEKHNTTATAAAPGGASRFAALAARSGAGTSSAAGRSSGATGAAGAGAGLPAGGFAGRFGGGSTGTITSVKGNTLVLDEEGGNSVTVTLSSVTKLSKSQSVGRGALRPGDTISVDGATQSDGSISATSVSDSGNTSTSTSSGSGAASTGSSEGGLSSLFSAGG